MVDSDGGGGPAGAAGAVDVTWPGAMSALAPWSTQSVMVLMSTLDKGPVGGICPPVVSEILWTSRLSLDLPATITPPEALPFMRPAAVSRCSPAGALLP